MTGAVAEVMMRASCGAPCNPAACPYTGRKTSIPLDVYIVKCATECGGSTEVFVLVTIYIDRVCRSASVALCKESMHRLFLVALLVASKHHNDRPLSNAVFAKIGGVTLRQINTMEEQFLRDVQWDLHVQPSLYAQYRRSLQQTTTFRILQKGFGQEAEEDL
eukprot:TRINITY_DN609_c1_g1_i3.p1 TRINITY_DN609_c1_g1~~TRINITY_DN609_c1_g1_i3.p1  ORF type:complete len:190 (+),score=58.39 TRINITY_DN609_c1_g1_i3:85-570(+)